MSFTRHSHPCAASAARRRSSVLVVRQQRPRRTVRRRSACVPDVFRAEPGFSLPAGSEDLDADHFDAFCDHVLVRENSTGAIVGCYRMLPPTASDAAGGYYTATEFDISELNARENGIVEMGRACVHPDHRSGSVLGLMWAGILHYLDVTGSRARSWDACRCRWTSATVSHPVRTYAACVTFCSRNMLQRNEFSRSARSSVDGRALDDIAPAARPAVPPLLRGYLRLGASICGEPSHDPDFGVADFVAVLRVADADVRYLDRLRAAARTVEGRLSCDHSRMDAVQPVRHQLPPDRSAGGSGAVTIVARWICGGTGSASLPVLMSWPVSCRSAPAARWSERRRADPAVRGRNPARRAAGAPTSAAAGTLRGGRTTCRGRTSWCSRRSFRHASSPAPIWSTGRCWAGSRAPCEWSRSTATSCAQLPGTVAAVRDLLVRAAAPVVVFPEGTTWCGTAYGSFRPAFFQAAIDAGRAVQPVPIRYRDERWPHHRDRLRR